MASKYEPLIELAKKYGPRLGAAIAALLAFLAKNPKLATWAREQLQAIQAELMRIYRLRGDAAKTRGILGIVRKRVEAFVAHGGVGSADGAALLARADKIEAGVDLAEHLGRPEKKTKLKELRASAESLLAELIDSVTSA